MTIADALEADWLEVSGLLRDARLQVSSIRYPIVRRMFLSLVTREQQLRFVHACSRDVRFNSAQVSQLCDDRKEIAGQIVAALFPCVAGRTSQLLLLGGVQTSFTSVSKEVSPCLWFQEGNLTGRYNLDLAKPADYTVAENCLLVNAWESEVGRLMSRPNVSQQGTYEMIRNESHNEMPFAYGRDWTLPSYGWLRFDYSSIRRPPALTAAMPAASEVTRYLSSNTLAHDAKLRALRAISVHMYLSSQQFRNLIQCFSPGVSRQDFFCTLHTRVVDPARLLGQEVLHAAGAQAVFDAADREALLSRVGHLHLLNPLHPETVRFLCNLAVYEERTVIDFLVQLASKEPGGKVLVWSKDEKHAVVPASWADKGVPIEDLIYNCTYDSTIQNLAWRQSLAERHCVGQFTRQDDRQ